MERELLPLVRDQGHCRQWLADLEPAATATADGGIDSGLLSGKGTGEGQGPAGSRRAQLDFPPVDTDHAFKVIDVLREIAADPGYRLR